MPKVFVSHASADASLVGEFVHDILMLGCGLDENLVFFSSGEGTGVPTGRNLLEHVRHEVDGAGIVVAVITPIFQTRPVCLAELGAAWARADRLFPLFVPSMEREDLEGVLDGLTTHRLDDKAALDELRDLVEERLGARQSTPKWNARRDAFIAKVPDLDEATAQPAVVSHADLDKAHARAQELENQLQDAQAEIVRIDDQLERLKAATSPEERAAALLPADEQERLVVLRDRALKAFKALPRIMPEVLWSHLRGDAYEAPTQYEDPDGQRQVVEAAEAGYLEELDAGTFAPDLEVRDVAAAVEAVDELSSFLSSASDPFFEWFSEKYGMPPELKRRLVWDAIL